MIRAHRNQFANVKNPFQGSTLKVLCVCSAGLLRSPTLASVLHQEWGFNVRACGSSEEYALIPLSEALVAWADLIVFVNHENYTEALFRNQPMASIIEGKSMVLDIQDDFEYNNPVLRTMLHAQFTEAYNSK